MMAAFLYILGGMGVIGRRNMDGAERNLTVASLMMFSFSYNLSWAPVLDPSPISSDVPS
jgi:hypothetical protein